MALIDFRRSRHDAKSTWGKVKSFARKVVDHSRPVFRNLASIPLTVAGFGLLAAAALTWNTTVGLASSGVLLIVLEYLIADDAE